jgi:virginiamycin A acetyltransferase
MVSLKIILYNLLRFQRFPTCNVKIGKYTTSVPYIISADRDDRVVIGKYCSIAHGVILIANQGCHVPPEGFEDYRVATYAVFDIKKHGFRRSYCLPEKRNFISIGNDVTVGANAIILSGITIGDGAVVGAGSVVTHDVPPFAVAAGVPAKIIRFRYSQDRIEKLMKIAWWNWSEDKIYENMDYFMGKVDAFIEKFYVEPKIGAE